MGVSYLLVLCGNEAGLKETKPKPKLEIINFREQNIQFTLKIVLSIESYNTTEF